MFKEIKTRKGESILLFLLLAGILLLGMALRSYNLGENSLWGDEVFTARADNNPYAIVFNLSNSNQQVWFIDINPLASDYETDIRGMKIWIRQNSTTTTRLPNLVSNSNFGIPIIKDELIIYLISAHN